MIRKHPKNSIRAGALLLVLICAAGTFGCKKEAPPAPAQPVKVAVPAQQQSKAVQSPVSSTLGLSPAPVNQFDFSTKKDPFKPFAVIKATPVLNSEKSSLPIHSFDISQFRLIGIITGGKQNQAMVIDPSGKGYVLKVGMTIGKSGGRITAISNSGVKILEQFRDDSGRVRKEYISITLPRK